MCRQKRQKFFIQLMLLAMLLAPLQSFAAVYANMGSNHPPVLAEAQACQYDGQFEMYKAGDHCMHDMQCDTHCDHCAHCQYFPTAPFALKQTPYHHVDRVADIAFISHIPQTSLRPPRLS